VQPDRAESLIPSGPAEPPFVSCTGRALSVRRGVAGPVSGAVPVSGGVPAPGTMPASGTVPASGAVPGRADQAGATILIADGWPSDGQAIAAVAGHGFKAVISAELDDFHRYNLIKTGIIPVCVDPETVAALQALVESDPEILLTVDIGRGEVRARGELAARFEVGSGPDNVARRLHSAHRLLRSAGLAGDAGIRLQRRLIAICDALKVPGADAARAAWRLDLLLADLARTCPPGQEAAPEQGASAGMNTPFP
jgi:hypothetical protein